MEFQIKKAKLEEFFMEFEMVIVSKNNVTGLITMRCRCQ